MRTEWEISLAGPENTLQRVACSIASLSWTTWSLLIVVPALIGGILVQLGIVSGTIGQLAYPVFCLCLWLALATIGGSYRSIQYRLDDSGNLLRIAREGYDPAFDGTASDQNPSIPLNEIRSVAVTTFPEHWVVRVDYETLSISKPDVVVILQEERSVWTELQQKHPSLPSLPSERNLALFSYARYAVTVVVVGVFPIALVDQQLLMQVLVIGSLLIALGLFRDLVSAIRTDDSNRESPSIPQAIGGTVKTSIAISVVLVIGYGINILPSL